MYMFKCLSGLSSDLYCAVSRSGFFVNEFKFIGEPLIGPLFDKRSIFILSGCFYWKKHGRKGRAANVVGIYAERSGSTGARGVERQGLARALQCPLWWGRSSKLG